MIRLQPYQRQQDARGSFLGITKDSWHEVNLVSTAAGAVRGNHFHRHTREMFCILSGQVTIDLEDVRTSARSTFEAGPGALFVVEPFERHTFSARTDCTWLNFLSHPFDAADPDFHQHHAGTVVDTDSGGHAHATKVAP